jgi:hypothetical protein
MCVHLFWCWRRMEISWTDHVRNEEVLLRVKERRNILHEISKRKANWIGHILRRNCLLPQVIEGKIKGGIKVTGRRGGRCRKLLYDFTKRRGCSHLKEEALDHTIWRARFGRGFGPVVRQTTKWMSDVTCFGLTGPSACYIWRWSCYCPPCSGEVQVRLQVHPHSFYSSALDGRNCPAIVLSGKNPGSIE